jgi:bifunctional non-homologous end joining protein LigD
VGHTKGPSRDPAVKRLAIKTEDHPIEYAVFEGVIPEGHYGAGGVMVWDKGSYEPEDDLSPEQQLAQGEIKLVLHGKKLRGGFVLLYAGMRFGGSGQKTRWLLIRCHSSRENSSRSLFSLSAKRLGPPAGIDPAPLRLKLIRRMRRA